LTSAGERRWPLVNGRYCAGRGEGRFDCAVVDLNLHGESALPIAEQLVAEGRSFAIATGYESPAVPAHLKAVPRIEKPFDPSALLDMVAQLSCARVG
jgi:hypothetical protein